MTVKLNTAAEEHASTLIAAGHYDATSDWSMSADDENKLLGNDDWTAYAKWFLAEDDAEAEKTKGRYKYPFGKDGKVYRKALIAIESRASTQGATEISDAAKRLLDALDKKEGDKAPKARSWFSIKSQDVNGNPVAPEIMVYDEIGAWGVSAADFDRELKSLGDVATIDMRINSPGGDSFAGIAIHNMIKNHPATVTAHVDGIAASAASLIAMAADKIVMPKNSFMVVHEPHAMTIGPSDAHLKMAADLERVSGAYAQAYADRTGQPLADVKSLMAEDRLMSADECKSKGYADEVADPMAMAATFDLAKLPEKHRGICASLYGKDGAVAADAAAKEARRIETIRTLGKQANVDDAFIEAAVTAGTSKKEFRKLLLAKLIEKPASEEIKVELVPTVAAKTEEGNGGAAPAVAACADPEYGPAQIEETRELCMIAGASIRTMQAFIDAKTPIAKVRAALADARARATDGIEIIPADVDPANVQNATNEARMKSWRETQEKTKREMGIRPRQ